MNFINNLLGGNDNGILTGILALAIVIALIVFIVWLLKLLLELSGNVGRGRAKRLDIVETLSLDQRRQLIIIRRDNVEHLIMTGGASEIIIENNIILEPKTNITKEPENIKKMQNIKNRIKAALDKNPVVEPVMGAVSLRHTGLLRRKDDELDIINPQTFSENGLNNEPRRDDSVIRKFEKNTKSDKSGDDSNKGSKK